MRFTNYNILKEYVNKEITQSINSESEFKNIVKNNGLSHSYFESYDMKFFIIYDLRINSCIDILSFCQKYGFLPATLERTNKCKISNSLIVDYGYLLDVYSLFNLIIMDKNENFKIELSDKKEGKMKVRDIKKRKTIETDRFKKKFTLGNKIYESFPSYFLKK